MTTTVPKPDFLQSDAIQEAVRALESAIAAGGGVLICGEAGTGRELFARAIHQASHVKYEGSIERLLLAGMKRPTHLNAFVAVECGRALELENRLFGCEPLPPEAAKNRVDRIGHGSGLHQALEGTLLLRQLPDMPRRLQARLAHVLDDGEAWVETPGQPPALTYIRVRPMATAEFARDEDPEIRVHSELLKRVSNTIIHLPPLRARREDIPALVRHLLAEICLSMNVPAKTASSQAAELLAALPWRGNLREMRGLLRALVLKVPHRLIRVVDVLANIRLDSAVTFRPAGTLKQARERFEREYVAAILEQHHGRMGEAAKALGIQRTNMYRKVRQLSVERRPRRNGV